MARAEELPCSKGSTLDTTSICRAMACSSGLLRSGLDVTLHVCFLGILSPISCTPFQFQHMYIHCTLQPDGGIAES
jgi:hypothetical protein